MKTSNLNLGMAAALAAAGLVLGACATQPQPVADATPSPSVDEILASAPQPDGNSRPVSCLPDTAYTDVEVINPELLLFHGLGDRMWLNQTRQACLGSRIDPVLAFDMRRGRLCDLDSVAVADNIGGHWSTGAACSLGKFAPVSPEQAELVRAELSRS
ncbi:MAG: hypothetical protein OXP28_17585 [Gammaproteobacteria bacterium]|nr:hypothetical protein [Gammaproteobacteria bacterium]MDE0226926.1 hypothetical protein [Gammaproteobacteria bacterium]